MMCIMCFGRGFIVLLDSKALCSFGLMDGRASQDERGKDSALRVAKALHDGNGIGLHDGNVGLRESSQFKIPSEPVRDGVVIE